MSYRRASEQDVERLVQIVDNAKEYMKQCGFEQWDNNYPTMEHIMQDIQRQECYVWEEDGIILGMATLCLEPEQIYEQIRTWKTRKPYGTIHRFAVAKEARGTMVANQLFIACEEICRRASGKGMRIDTHEQNKTMQAFLNKHEYEQCGIVYYGERNEDSKRITYEKVFNC